MGEPRLAESDPRLLAKLARATTAPDRSALKAFLRYLFRQQIGKEQVTRKTETEIAFEVQLATMVREIRTNRAQFAKLSRKHFHVGGHLEPAGTKNE